MSSVNRDVLGKVVLLLPVQTICPLFIFLFCFALSGSSSIMMNKIGESKILALFPVWRDRIYFLTIEYVVLGVL